jgi:phosphate transport system substrate-binding protein
MKRWFVVLAAALTVAAGAVRLADPAAAGGSQIWVVGSSTLRPFTVAVAARAAKAAQGPAPIVEETGTTLALEYLCGGAGFPNAASVTRRMRRIEFDACRQNGAGEIVEVPIGLDILVVAQSRAGPDLKPTLVQMFLALARDVPDGKGGLVANAYRRWSKIDPALPDIPINVRALPKALEARDDLQDLFVHKGAERIAVLAAVMAKTAALHKSLRTVRHDADVLVEHATEDEIVRQLVANPGAVGVLPYRYLQANRATLRAVPIDGADPEQDAYSGRYPGARGLYLYVRKADFDAVPGLSALGAEYVSSAALGPDGYLLKLGFVPLPAEEMIKAFALAKALPALRRETLPQ